MIVMMNVTNAIHTSAIDVSMVQGKHMRLTPDLLPASLSADASHHGLLGYRFRLQNEDHSHNK